MYAAHNPDNSIVKVFGYVSTGTNTLSRVAIPGLYNVSGQQQYGVRTNIHFGINKACLFEFVGLYSQSVNGNNLNGFIGDSSSIGIGADGYVYFGLAGTNSPIAGNTCKWIFLNIPLLIGD